MNLRIITVVLATLVALAANTTAEARHRSHHHYAHSGGACDGIHRCRCGSTQASYFNLPRMYNGHNLWQAIEWPAAFPHTSLRVGVVMYRHGGGPTGHVSRVASISEGCKITVIDETGEHPDSACGRGNIFVEVTDRSFAGNTTTLHASKHKRHRGAPAMQQLASVNWWEAAR